MKGTVEVDETLIDGYSQQNEEAQIQKMLFL